MLSYINSKSADLNYTLFQHETGYTLKVIECLQMPFFSPYAARHWELSKTCPENFWGHRIIACFEALPVIGLMISLAERITVYALIKHFGAHPSRLECYFKKLNNNKNCNTDTKIRNGYGEFIAYHEKEGIKSPLNKKEFKKAYDILNRFTASKLNSNDYESRHLKILNCVKNEISQDCKIVFIPRTLCELILVRKCLEEENKNHGCLVRDINIDILKNNVVAITDDKIKYIFRDAIPIKKVKEWIKTNKCWHRCYFNNAGNNQHPDVEKIAYKFHKEILKNPKFQKVNNDFSFNDLLSYTKRELQNIHNYNWLIKTGEDEKLILKCITIECSQISQRSVLLYRGANFSQDNCKSKLTHAPYSLSYGTGLFAGYLYESNYGVNGAMAFDYMHKDSNDAYVSTVSVDDFHTSPVYVPGTNTYCQFAGYGEIFHARSKGWKSFDIQKMRGFQQGEIRRNHLISSLTEKELTTKFDQIKKNSILLKLKK